jgi:hypothetical protein
MNSNATAQMVTTTGGGNLPPIQQRLRKAKEKHDKNCPLGGVSKARCLCDQPKPTGEWIGGNCKFCNEPDGKHKPDCRRPATGEWTMETLESYRVHGGFRAYKLLEDINAALAAEREEVRQLEAQLSEETQEGNPQEYGDSN